MEQYRLRTPEAVDVSYDVAGIGTRFLAAAIDFGIIVVALIIVVVGALALGQATGNESAAIIAGGTVGFILFWGYFLLFETLWSGQTPGKRRMRIRAIKTSGYPIGFLQSSIRNLVRIVDFLPSFYGVGVIVMFVSTESRRLGDYAAGTIVVKEGRRLRLEDLGVETKRDPVLPRSSIDPDEMHWNLDAIGPDDLAVVHGYLDRADSLAEGARRTLGEDIAGRLAERIDARRPLDPARFLRRVVELREDER